MMINFKFIVFAGVILTSCTLDKPKDSGNDATAKTIEEKPAKVIVKTPVSFKGLYQYSKEANILQDCNDPNKIYWINDSLANMSEAYKKATQFLSYPGETAYAEVKGYLAGKAISGDASDYENVLVVTSVNKLDQKNFRTDCYNYEFITLGNEPFWSVDIIPANQKIILKYDSKKKFMNSHISLLMLVEAFIALKLKTLQMINWLLSFVKKNVLMECLTGVITILRR
jgi:hypothetical protein